MGSQRFDDADEAADSRDDKHRVETTRVPAPPSGYARIDSLDDLDDFPKRKRGKKKSASEPTSAPTEPESAPSEPSVASHQSHASHLVSTVMRPSKAVARTVAITVAAVVGMSLSACGSAEDNPRRVVDRFMHALAARDVKGAAAQTGSPDVASTAIAEMWAGLDAEKLDYSTGKVRLSVDNALADVTYTWHLPGKREWRYTAQVAASRAMRAGLALAGHVSSPAGTGCGRRARRLPRA